MLNVAVNIIGEQFCRFFLYLTVLLYCLGITAEKIAEGKVAMQFSGILWADVQMMLWQMGLVRVVEGFAIGDAQVTFVAVTDGR